MTRRTAAGLALLGLLATARAPAQVTCATTEGPPGEELTLELSITSPPDGTVVRGCTRSIDVSGTWSIRGRGGFDVYLVIDTSGSTAADSGWDVDADGQPGEREDDVLHGEVASARAYLDAMEAEPVRVALITFAETATVRQQLTSDLASVRAALDALESESPLGLTAFAPALDAVEAEVLARGDPAGRAQHCAFLSDGEPDDDPLAIDAAVQRLVALPVVVDTFQVGPGTGDWALDRIARDTSGMLTDLQAPELMASLLPAFVPASPWRFTADGAPVTYDATTFSAVVDLEPRPDRIYVVLRAVSRQVSMSVTCSVLVTWEPDVDVDAGYLSTKCRGQPMVLDGSRTTGTCDPIVYEWRDCYGRQVCPPSYDPTCSTVMGSCYEYVLRAWCEADPCVLSDAVGIDATPIETEASGPSAACPGSTIQLRGSVFNGMCPGALYRWRDCTGREVCPPTTSRTCDVTYGPCTQWRLDVTCPESGCGASDVVDVSPLFGAEPSIEVDWACPSGASVSVPWVSGSLERGLDLDVLVDSDGDGDPLDDRDAGTSAILLPMDGPTRPVAAWIRNGDCVATSVHVIEFAGELEPPWMIRETCEDQGWAELGCAQGVTCGWDLDVTIDSDGNGVPDDDLDQVEPFLAFDSMPPGYVVRAAVSRFGDCVRTDPIVLVFTRTEPWTVIGGACPGRLFELSCGDDDGVSEWWWDVDTTADSDGDGVPDNDGDSVGCSVAYEPLAGVHEIALWQMHGDWEPCTLLVGRYVITIADGARPAEVPGQLLLERDGFLVHRWQPVPGASEYRVLRGTIASLASGAYDHVVDQAVGAGWCVVGDLTAPADDAWEQGDFYYLVTAISQCGGPDSPTGSGRTHSSDFERPAGTLVGCP